VTAPGRAANPVFCALDTPDPVHALGLAAKLHGRVGGFKLGLEFFAALGPAGFRAIAETAPDMPLFLDLKLHDIPNTVEGAVAALLPLKPAFLTVHAAGGSEMMRAARKAADKAGAARPKLLGVTVLTSLDGENLAEVGQDSDVARQTLRLAKLAKDSGLNGAVCSPQEIAPLRTALGPDFILMVPGIRPSWAATNDQKRVMTPKEAMQAGASYLVIGRPITGASDPAAAADRVINELA